MSEKVKKEIFEWIKVFALAIVFAFVITQFIKPTLVRGNSMYSTLEEGDYCEILAVEGAHLVVKKINK